MALLNNKIAFVSGAASGIGRATALLLSREGAAVVAADRMLDTVELVCDEVRAIGGQAFAVSGDVASLPEVDAMMELAVAHYGRLDCAVNAAGVAPAHAAFAEISDDDWSIALAVNLTGMRNCMKSQIDRMNNGGSIVNVASGAGLEGAPGLGAYVASKHGVIGITKVAALDYAKRGIRINALCPGLVATPMTQAGIDGGHLDIASLCPSGRPGRPEEIAEAAAWLCSDRASYVTGIAMPVDGGHLAG